MTSAVRSRSGAVIIRLIKSTKNNYTCRLQAFVRFIALYVYSNTYKNTNFIEIYTSKHEVELYTLWDVIR